MNYLCAGIKKTSIEMKHTPLFGTLALAFLVLFPWQIFAQSDDNKIKVDFSGFIRVDYYYDSRQSVTSNEGLLFLYPKDVAPDSNGEDLNDVPNAGLYSFNTRPALTVSGLKLLDANVKGFVEADFAGYSGSSTLLRIRLAYMNFDWDKFNLTIGQQWHPFFYNARPSQLAISTGAPYQPFNRSPQIRGEYRLKDLTFSGAAIYQFQYQSHGPDGKSAKYMKQAIIPELALMIDYKKNQFKGGIGIDYLTISPRTQSQVIENQHITNTYKVDESLSSLSYTAYVQYTDRLFSASAKSSLMENPAHLSMLGGYGIKSIGEYGKQEYTPFRYSASWLNLSYGKTYLTNLMLGYMKNLGSKDELVAGSSLYGEGMSVQELYGAAISFSYNIPHFRFGVEYEFTRAKYGDEGTINWSDGLYDASHGVNDHRILGTVSYIF